MENTLGIGSSSNQSTQLIIEAGNTAGAPATTSSILMKGYEGRGQGIFFTDSSQGSEEWFAGLNYASSWNTYSIGFDASGGQSEYTANSLFSVHGPNKMVGIETWEQELGFTLQVTVQQHQHPLFF